MQPMLTLEDFALTRLQFEFHEGSEDPREKQASFPLGINYDLARHKSDRKKFLIRFELELGRGDQAVSGYTLNAQITGYFLVDADIDGPLPGDYLVHGCALLYGVLRGQLSLITGAASLGRITLPTVPMGEIVAKLIKSKHKDVEPDKLPSGKEQRKSPKKASPSKTAKGTVRKKPRN